MISAGTNAAVLSLIFLITVFVGSAGAAVGDVTYGNSIAGANIAVGAFIAGLAWRRFRRGGEFFRDTAGDNVG